MTRVPAAGTRRGFTWTGNIYWENTKAPFKGHNPEWTIDAALKFVTEHQDRPFFVTPVPAGQAPSRQDSEGTPTEKGVYGPVESGIRLAFVLCAG